MQSMRFLFKTQPAQSLPDNAAFTRKALAQDAVTPS